MTLATMRFSGHQWKYNPLTLKITQELSYTRRGLADSGEAAVDPRMRVSVFSGKGELFGADCIEQYKEMEKVFRRCRKGILTLPDRAPVYAYFTKLASLATDTPDLIEYSFEFVECSAGNASEIPHCHIGKEGDTLYSVAYEYGVAIEELVKLNPWIKRPDRGLEGKKVRLC